MILGFKTEIFGKPTNFVSKICLAYIFNKPANIQKIHTIRKGNRFKGGEKLHMATGVRTKHYEQFNLNIEGLQRCISVQDIKISWKEFPFFSTCIIEIDGKEIQDKSILAMNDGFTDTLNYEHFLKYFNTDFEGQIIHWTDYRY